MSLIKKLILLNLTIGLSFAQTNTATIEIYSPLIDYSALLANDGVDIIDYQVSDLGLSTGIVRIGGTMRLMAFTLLLAGNSTPSPQTKTQTVTASPIIMRKTFIMERRCRGRRVIRCKDTGISRRTSVQAFTRTAVSLALLWTRP